MIKELPRLLPCREKIRADLHAHFSPRIGLENLVRASLHNGTNLLALTSHPKRWDYEQFTSRESLENLPSGWRFYQDERITFVETDAENRIYLLNSHEVETGKGHIVFVGNKKEERVENKGNIKEIVLNSDKKLIVFVPHPFMRFMGFRDNLDEAVESVNVLEYNSHAIFSNSRSLEYAQKNKLKVLANSDTHYMPRYIGRARTIFDESDFNFDNGNNFLYSLKENIHQGNFRIHKGNVPFYIPLYLAGGYLISQVFSRKQVL